MAFPLVFSLLGVNLRPIFVDLRGVAYIFIIDLVVLKALLGVSLAENLFLLNN